MWIRLREKSSWSDTVKLLNGDQIREITLIQGYDGLELWITWAHGEAEIIAKGTQARQFFKEIAEQLRGEAVELEPEGGE